MKDCNICVYNGACEDRQDDQSIIDCCVPEAPLRKRQREVLDSTCDIALYGSVTNTYIMQVKSKSKYWTKHNK